MDFLVSGHQSEDFEGRDLAFAGFWPRFRVYCMDFLRSGRQNEDFEGLGLDFSGFWCCRAQILGVLRGFSGFRASKRMF